jgi:2-phospho-L-lactate transferase/gluconeogenesis factor (CofD/UPF0052 family)
MKNHIFSPKIIGLSVVSIGGGTGLSTLLSGLKKYVNASETEPIWLERLSGIVAVSDDGGSSGRLRDELNMLAPGDIRSCMVALSEDSTLLSQLFQHRFEGDGELGGHSFGNIFLAALTQISIRLQMPMFDSSPNSKMEHRFSEKLIFPNLELLLKTFDFYRKLVILYPKL